MQQLIFCDEFGNTGPNLADNVQPAFVYAFLTVASSALQEVLAELSALRRTMRLQVPNLKSKILWKTNGGLALFRDIAKVLVCNNASVCLSIVEKRYQICTTIVETYLDPGVHDGVPWQLGLPQFKQRFADAAYDALTTDRLNAFLNASAKGRDELSRIGEEIATALQLHPDPFVQYAAQHMQTCPSRLFRYGEPCSGLPPSASVPASQFAAFFPGLERVDAFLDAMGWNASLLRDRDSKFGEFLDVTYSYGQQLDSIPGGRLYGAQRQLTNIRTCRETISEESVGIQLADLAAGAFGRAIVTELKGERPGELEMAVIEEWRALLLQRDNHYWMVSDAVLDAVQRAVCGPDVHA